MGTGSLPTPIAAPVLFPFEPDGGATIRETWKYVTNVITSEDDSEQRIALRSRPALRVGWSVLGMEPGEAGLLAGLLYTNPHNRWYVPLWYSRRGIAGVAGGVYTPTSLVGTTFEVNGKALVWNSITQVDLMTVTAIGASTVTLAGVPTFTHKKDMVIVPVGIGGMSMQNEISRMSIATGFAVSFDLDRVNTPAIITVAAEQLFEGIEVLKIHPSTDGTEGESWIRSAERIGGDLGPVLYRALGPTPIVTRPKTWVLTTNAEIAGFRNWLATRRGKWRSLWVPTYTDDLTLVAPTTNGATSIDIAAIGFEDTFLPLPSRQRVALLVPSETVLPFRVIGVAYPAVGVERLQISAAVGAALSSATRCCFLVRARLSTDEITIEHEGLGLAVVNAAFVEVPREVAP